MLPISLILRLEGPILSQLLTTEYRWLIDDLLIFHYLHRVTVNLINLALAKLISDAIAGFGVIVEKFDTSLVNRTIRVTHEEFQGR